MAQPQRGYQTFDMTGKPAGYQHAPPRPGNYQQVAIQTAVSRPYDDPVGQPGNPRAAPVHPHHHSHDYVAPAPQYGPGPDHPHLVAEEDKLDLDTQQSRTFRVLQSLMQNDEPYAGTAGLPPLRTASMEKWKYDQQARREQPARVKVFMPAAYNTPLNMYSGENILDSFQSQAETQLQPEGRQLQALTPAQQAVMEEDRQRQMAMQQCVSDL